MVLLKQVFADKSFLGDFSEFPFSHSPKGDAYGIIALIALISRLKK